ncbi:MAG: hypothetical protein AAGE59_20365 [Cyanobacteria bacterium P01_F01_bin.86]
MNPKTISEAYDFPPPTPLHRLNVHDNLTINAERWLMAHNYHRQRQSLEYQSLTQPGIVYGLGVKVIDPPPKTRFKDQRWLEVQPGMAIDYQGNFIIVSAEHDRTYRLAVPAPQKMSTTVYLIVKYVDPDGLALPEERERVPEQFRLDETTQPPNPNLGEIELCRIHVAVGEVYLEMPERPMHPGPGQPNLLHRQPAKARSQAYLCIGLLSPHPNRTQQRINSLVDTLPALYPALHATVDIITDMATLHHCGLVYLQREQLSALSQMGQQFLQDYAATGGTLLLEVNAAETVESYRDAIAQLWPELSLQPAEPPLTTRPFLFGQLPTIGVDTLQLLQSDGILLLTQPLSEHWGPFAQVPDGIGLPRHEIRTAHELGINLLKFAWHRHQLYRLLQ